MGGCATMAPVIDSAVAGGIAGRMEDALENAKTYEFGQSREPLMAIDEVTVDALANPGAADPTAEVLTDYLYSDATWDAKRHACRQLRLLADEDDVERIAPMLYDDDTADMARYALERIDSPVVDEALIDALPLTAGATRIGIINSLGARGSEKAVRELEGFVENGTPDEQVAAAAAIEHITL